jgi:stage II sporulation protein D
MQKPLFNIIFLLLFLLFALQANSAENLSVEIVKVELFSKEKVPYICFDKPVKIKRPTLMLDKNSCIKPDSNALQTYNTPQKVTGTLPKFITLQSTGNNDICLHTQTIKDRCYTGEIQVSLNNKYLQLQNKVPLLDYLYSTTAGEIHPDWHTEAVKAQAVAIHSYLLYLIQHNKPVLDSTQSQFYGGTTFVNPEFSDPINKVANIIMVDENNLPIEALYHSTCAGYTLNNEDVFGGKPVSYLRGTPCEYCKDSPFFYSHTFEINKTSLKKQLHTKVMHFLKDKNDCLQNIQLDNKTLSSYQFWLMLGQKLGWGAVPGVKYNILCHNVNCKLKSRGAGHNVGLCQWGANGMAKKGFNYKHVLRYYYKNIHFLKTGKSKRVQL